MFRIVLNLNTPKLIYVLWIELWLSCKDCVV